MLDIIHLTNKLKMRVVGGFGGGDGWKVQKKCGFWGGRRSLGFMLGAFCGIGGENYLMDAAAVSVRWQKYRKYVYGKQQ